MRSHLVNIYGIRLGITTKKKLIALIDALRTKSHVWKIFNSSAVNWDNQAKNKKEV